MAFLADCLGTGDLHLGLRAGAGLAICMAIPGAEFAARDRLQELARRVDQSWSGTSWEALGFDTLLLAAHAFRLQKIVCPELERMLHDLYVHLGGQREDDGGAQPSPLTPASVFLARLLGERSVGDSAAQRLPLVEVQVGESESAAAFAGRLMASCGGDASRLDWGGPEQQHIIAWLAWEMVLACEEYRLADAAVTLRLLIASLGPDDRVVRDAVTYLLSQQTPAGVFGFLWGSQSDDPGDAADLLAANLNWTLAVAWAIADAAFPEDSVTRLFSC